jgi:hypothetical protein
MAKTPTKTETAIPEPAYTEVTLSRMVELQGHAYRPGVKHVVDAATLAALGDAVATKRPLNA